MKAPAASLISTIVWFSLSGFAQDSLSIPIAKLRATPRVEAASRPEVHVRGIVSLVGEGLASPTNTPAMSSICLEDDTAGIWVNVSQARRENVWLGQSDVLLELHEGSEIEMERLLDPGAFAPVILPRSIRILGEKPLPPPRAPSLQRLMSGGEDVRRIVVSGVVQNIVDGKRTTMVAEGGNGTWSFFSKTTEDRGF